MSAPSIDIILPCYNPVDFWEEFIISTYQEINNLLPNVINQLIIVNDGSVEGINENSIAKLRDAIPRFNYINYSINKGKGHALREGVKKSTAAICIYTDIDFPYTTSSFLKIWKQLNDGKTDIAVGIKDKNYYQQVPLTRRIISKILRFCTNFIFGLKISDTQCGLKGFNAKGKELFLQTTIDRYLFDLEFIFLASRNKSLNLSSIEIELKKNVQFTSIPFVILFKDGLSFLHLFFKSI